ncbi:MAG: ATP-binding protein [Syntrophorhabdaceae bacterium]|nr:ATP-binding protein [Syntrophorhabdaceae bacterium]MDD5243482.1 ATP-binding protein [Syntrophorhabdaceae bacterium]
MIERIVKTYLFDPELNAGKMVFLTGPRQVGKTTFAKEWLKGSGMEDMYFNWDDPSVAREYRRNPLIFRNLIDEKYRRSPVPIVFDEIHKQRDWRNILKGFYDTNKGRMTLLVTGSARLGLYRKTGDSLVGRYLLYQIFPLGLPEVVADFSRIAGENVDFSDGEGFIRAIRSINIKGRDESLSRLLTYGGFPEPFSKASQRFFTRWQREYRTLLTREDVRDLSRVSDIRGIEQLAEILPSKVGSPLSINSLREDLGCHYATIVNWIHILAQLYLLFTVRPWHKRITRSIKKEVKLYFFDWTTVPDTGYRFENFIAVTLLRMAARLTETGLGTYEIMYVRDREKREVDFVLVKNGKPVALFEAKEGDTRISPAGKYFAGKLGVPFYQIVNKPVKAEAFPGNCFIIPSTNFCMFAG